MPWCFILFYEVFVGILCGSLNILILYLIKITFLWSHAIRRILKDKYPIFEVTLTNNAHECYLTRRHWPTRDPYQEL